MRSLAAFLVASVLLAVPSCERTGLHMPAGAGGTMALGGVTATGGAFAAGGVAGTGGSSSESGGVVGNGGTRATGGATSTGGTLGSGGAGGAGGATRDGGLTGSGGVAGKGGVAGTGGSVGTGGTMGTGGSPGGGGGGACSNVAACGGDVVGTWTVTSSCLNVTGQMDLSVIGVGCTSAVTGSLKVTGTWTANPNGTYSDKTTTSGNEQLTLPASCLQISGTTTTCERVAPVLQALGYAVTTCQSAASGGGCTCSATVNQTGWMGVVNPDASTSGGYTTSGTVITLDSEAKYSFCVAGNKLNMTSQGTSPTTTGTVVLQKNGSTGSGGAPATRGSGNTTGSDGGLGSGGIGGTGGASGGAVTCTFGGLPVDGETLLSYTESGITVLATAGDWQARTGFGNPAPSILFSTSVGGTATGQVKVTAGGSAFRFVSVDLYSSMTTIPYVFTGQIGSTQVFSVSGTVPNTFGNFAKVANPNAGDLIDTLVIELANGVAQNSMGLDNLRLMM